MIRRLTHIGWSATALLLLACGEEAPNEPDPGPVTIAASIQLSDTNVWRGESIVVSADAQYETSTGAPISIAWSVSDSTVLSLAQRPLLAVTVTAEAIGTAWLRARINDTVSDSVSLSVVDNGVVKWRRALGAGVFGLDLAVGADGRVYAAGQSGLFALHPDGSVVWEAPGCFTGTGPAVTEQGVYEWGTRCARRVSLAGTVIWEDTTDGHVDPRQAVAGNGDLVVLGGARDTIPQTITRFDGGGGVVVWRDSIGVGPSRSGVAIAANGDVYVARYSNSVSDPSTWVWRLRSDGNILWVRSLPGAPYQNSPAVLNDRVYVSHRAGITAYDTTGALMFERTWPDIGGWPTRDDFPPEVVLDSAGNVYAAGRRGLFSLGPSGEVRWVADSLGGGRYDSGPSVLEGQTLVVRCGWATCGVSSATGARLWRGPDLIEGFVEFGGLAVGPDGTLYAMIDGEVLALWHRGVLASSGWPTLGGNRGRSGTAPN